VLTPVPGRVGQVPNPEPASVKVWVALQRLPCASDAFRQQCTLSGSSALPDAAPASDSTEVVPGGGAGWNHVPEAVPALRLQTLQSRCVALSSQLFVYQGNPVRVRNGRAAVSGNETQFDHCSTSREVGTGRSGSRHSSSPASQNTLPCGPSASEATRPVVIQTRSWVPGLIGLFPSSSGRQPPPFGGRRLFCCRTAGLRLQAGRR
jgi:hypothetical protein